MIHFANQHEIDAHNKSQRAKIYDSYVQSGGRDTATAITKAELDEQYPADQWERYTLQALHQFRSDLMKAEGVDDKDGAFKEATKDLKSFVVHHDGKKNIVFVGRKEEAGE